MIKKIRLNLGCASRPLKNYINVDQDSLSIIKKRYPNLNKIKKLKIHNHNIFKLPYKDSTVDEIRADGLIEHLTFVEERKFFYEIKRVVKKGGIIRLSTVDFEKTGASSDASGGGNTFNGDFIMHNSGTGYFMIPNNVADDYNGDVTYIKSSTGLLYPSYFRLNRD